MRLPLKEKLSLIGNLSTMLGAGIPMYETVESLLEDSKAGSKKILEQLREDLSSGYHINDTLVKFPLVFSKIDVNLIKAAEEAGKLETTLIDLRENIQKEMEFSDKIKAALTYPILVMLVFFIVLLTMLIVVVPRISSVFSRLKVALPLPTVILMKMSESLIAYWQWYLAGGVVSIIFLIYLYSRHREKLFGVLYKLPFISGLVKKIDLAKFSRTMYLLLSSGITFTHSLELAGGVMLTGGLSKMIAKAKDDAIGGKRFSEALRSYRTDKVTLPSIILKLIEVGEKTGKLDQSMQDISKKMDYEVNKSLLAMTALLEPVMLIIVGVAVGGMMLAIIAPIYGLISEVART